MPPSKIDVTYSWKTKIKTNGKNAGVLPIILIPLLVLRFIFLYDRQPTAVLALLLVFGSLLIVGILFLLFFDKPVSIQLDSDGISKRKKGHPSKYISWDTLSRCRITKSSGVGYESLSIIGDSDVLTIIPRYRAMKNFILRNIEEES
jgi:hypothetical protein